MYDARRLQACIVFLRLVELGSAGKRDYMDAKVVWLLSTGRLYFAFLRTLALKRCCEFRRRWPAPQSVLKNMLSVLS